MKTLKNRLRLIPVGLFVFLFAGSIFCSEVMSAEPLLPQGLVMKDKFVPGFGRSVGKVRVIQGEALVVHSNSLNGYSVTKNLPLYKKDTIITQPNGRLQIELSDSSTMTMASSTKLVLSESVYEPEKKSRLSFFRMSLGKARFYVRKFADYKNSGFKVRTPTAVVGVRGSDFILAADEESTEVTTLGDTSLEVLSLFDPDADPTLLEDFERTIIDEGELPTPPVDISDEIDGILQDFSGTADGSGLGGGIESGGQEPAGEEPGEEEPGDEEPGEEEPGGPPPVFVPEPEFQGQDFVLPEAREFEIPDEVPDIIDLTEIFDKPLPNMPSLPEDEG